MNTLNSVFSDSRKFCQVLIALLLGAVMALPINAQQAEQTWTVNFRDADIQELIRFVAKTTNRTLIVDPKVKGKVQVISSSPVNSEELYELFLSILEVQGFAAVDSGDVTRIIPAKDARTAPVEVRTSGGPSSSSEVITQVIQLENISAAKLIPVLRPLAPQQAHMAAYSPSNAIILSDTAANITRIREIIENIDLSAVQKTDVVSLQHASAEEIVRMLEQLQKNESQKGKAETKKTLLVADKRTNSVLISGDEIERQRIKVLITHLDTPLTQSGNVRVVYLEYAEAKDLAGVLSNVVQNMSRMQGSGTAKKGAKKSDLATIEADEGTNALIITAGADIMQSLLSVVERLDIRRAQVLVEAIIVEMTDDNGQELGVEWLFLNDNGAYGSSSRGDGSLGSAIAGEAFKVDDDGLPLDTRAGVGNVISNTAGQVLGIGRLDDDLSFNVVINALQTNSEANILSTPSLLTLDNEEASIVVGQSIPFVTGSYTSTGDSGSNPDNPFQTVERENVGITLKVTPQINEGDSLVLAISQEVSNVLSTNTLNGNLITSERKIDTKVLANNGQVIVLGGLMEDNVTETVQKVPLLGDIPYLGRLFRTQSTKVGKKHLLVFLRPTIVRDNRQMDAATAKKYRLIRKDQLSEIEASEAFGSDLELPLLPEWEEQLEMLKDIQAESDAAQKASTSEEAASAE
ncbi:type II secretion system secretin GspD [bacterium]|nr:type II secretion system secretin GspD [bacterium]